MHLRSVLLGLSVGSSLCVIGALAVNSTGSRRLEQIALAGTELARFDNFDMLTDQNVSAMLDEGRKTFRLDTFGDERSWGHALRLHQAIKKVPPRAALRTLGLKGDVDAMPTELVDQLSQGEVTLDDPAVTVQLLKLNAVVGVTGFFDANGARSSL